MRLRLFSVTVVAIIAMISTGCGNSIESDARKFAELECRAKKASEKQDLSSMSEALELSAEAMKLGKELKEKYTGEDLKQFRKAYRAARDECK